MDDATSATTKESERPPKRLRVSQACEPCRTKKGKCDGRQPTCSACDSLEIDCFYDPNPKKRGLRPGQVSALERRVLLTELIVAFLINQFPSGEDSIRSFFCPEDLSLPFLLPDSKFNELREQLNKWRAGSVSRWLLGTAARVDPALDQLSRFRQQGPSIVLDADFGERTVLQRLVAPASDTSGSPKKKTDQENDSSLNRNLSLPTNISKYLDIYFAYTHAWLPMVDKFKLTDFCRRFTSKSHASSCLGPSKSMTLALVWAIIAYTSLHMVDTPNEVSKSFEDPKSAARTALSLIPPDSSEVELEHAQALVLLALSYFEQGFWNTSWRLIGLAGRNSVDVGIINGDQHISSASRRTFLACFVVEGIIAAFLRQQSQFSTTNKQLFAERRINKLEEEGWEEWSSWKIPGRKTNSSPSSDEEPFRGLSTFNQVIQLVEILNKSLVSLSIDDCSRATLTVQRGLSKLSAFMQRVRESYPVLASPDGSEILHVHFLNFQCQYWMSRCVLHWHLTEAEPHRKGNGETSYELATKVHRLADQYRTVYPAKSAPLAVPAALTTALRLVGADCPIGRSLTELLFDMREQWRGSLGDAQTLPNLQRPERRLGCRCSLIPCGTGSKSQPNPDHSSRSREPMLVEDFPRDDTMANESVEPMLTSTTGNLSEELDLGVTSLDRSDMMSISGHDLTVLDAVVWTDDLFATNLGYPCNSPTRLDPDLGGIIDSDETWL